MSTPRSAGKPPVYLWAEATQANDELIARLMKETPAAAFRFIDASRRDPVDVLRGKALVAILDQQWCDTYLLSARSRGQPLDNQMAQAISLALREGIPVFPVLLNGATFPKFTDMPPELSGLLRAQAYALTLNDGERTNVRLTGLWFTLEVQLGLRKVSFTPIWVGLACACLEVAAVAMSLVTHTWAVAIIGAAVLLLPLYLSVVLSYVDATRRGLSVVLVLLLYGGEALLTVIAWKNMVASPASIAGTVVGTVLCVGFFFLFLVFGFYNRARVGGGEVLLRQGVEQSNGHQGATVREFFLSYRREDSEEFTQRIYDFLLSKGRGAFIDRMALVAGADFAAELERMLHESIMVFVIIGPKWLSASFPGGGRRIDDPNDYVRREVAAALKMNKVVPIVVDETPLVTRDELPHELAELARPWPRRVHSDQRFASDMSIVLKQMQGYFSPELVYQHWDIAIGISVALAFYIASVLVGPLVVGLTATPITPQVASLIAYFPTVATIAFLLTSALATTHAVRSGDTAFVIVLVVWSALTLALQAGAFAAASSSPWQLSVIMTTLWWAVLIIQSYIYALHAAGRRVVFRRTVAQTLGQDMAVMAAAK